MNRRARPLSLLFFTAIAFLFLAISAQAASIEVQNYRRAFALLDAGHPDAAIAFTRHGHDPVLNKVLLGAYMAHPGNDVSFDEMAAFIRAEPDWPNLKGILAIAEQKIPPNAPLQQIIDWFGAHPPVSLVGFYRYIDALNASGQTQSVADLIHARWRTGEFSPDEMAAFTARFPMFLGRNENWARLDHLLWKNDVPAAQHMLSYVDGDMRTVAETRLALANQASSAEAWLNRVPDAWQNDPGLLYERLRWRRRNNLDDDAIDILQHAPENLVEPEAWWEERQIMARRLMDKRNYELAYKLTVEHGQASAKTVVQAEFLAGWLALRFLNDPSDARDHFQTLYDSASTPISRARGAYWLGRAYEALGDKNAAEQAYENAATLNMTYYGQIAIARLYAKPTIQATPEPTIPQAVRANFYNRDSVAAVERLTALGERDRARGFFHAVVEYATQRVEFALLTELATKVARPDLAIEAAKAANQKNILITAGGYPLLGRHIPQPPEPALIHALIRQESMFNPEAESGAGARGLMQLMPSTAKSIAKQIGVRYKPQRLTEPDYSLQLGTAFVQNQIDDFNGSYVLALAGYNAGPHRVREWMEQIGDPRHADIDPVDWIEEIPVPETRNYVQRIIENLQIYRARLNGGQAPLLILKDLKR